MEKKSIQETNRKEQDVLAIQDLSIVYKTDLETVYAGTVPSQWRRAFPERN